MNDKGELLLARLILASQSEARRRLLKRLGRPFAATTANVDEDQFKAKVKDPKRLVEVLAYEKARDVAGQNPKSIVIGSDQVLALGKKIYGKPGSRARAIEQLESLSGKTARLLTGVCVLAPNGKKTIFVDEVKLVFRKMSRAEITRYVKLDRPYECAGSFKIEEHGVTLFDRVETKDPSGIEGLPLMKLAAVLRKIESESSLSV